MTTAVLPSSVPMAGRSLDLALTAIHEELTAGDAPSVHGQAAGKRAERRELAGARLPSRGEVGPDPQPGADLLGNSLPG